MQKLYIPVLAGTTRAERKSIFAAQLVAEVGASFENVETELIDPKDFTFPGDGNDPGEQDPRYSAITKRADGFFIVFPEYNHSFPGSLKRMLDSELENYIHKSVAFGSVSKTPWGGVRGIESLVNVVREMGLVSTFTDVQFPNVQELFNEQGELQDEHYREYVKRAWVELIWLTQVLQYGRKSIASSYHAN